MRARPRTGAQPKDVHERALGLLAVRQRSRRELERRLTQAGFEPDQVAEELRALERVGLVDDEAFARALTEQRFGARKQGRRAVASALAAAGVARETASAVLDELDVDEQARADAFAASKAARLRGVGPDVAYRRLYGALARRGFSPEVSREAVRRALAVEAFED